MIKHFFILITSELETRNHLQSYHHNMKEKKKTLKASSKQKIYLIKNKK